MGGGRDGEGAGARGGDGRGGRVGGCTKPLQEYLRKERERKCVPYIFPLTHEEGFAVLDRLKFACFRLFFLIRRENFLSSTPPLLFFLLFPSSFFPGSIPSGDIMRQ